MKKMMERMTSAAVVPRRVLLSFMGGGGWNRGWR
jgi:hypothetical protein